jgi:hypothetical protein
LIVKNDGGIVQSHALTAFAEDFGKTIFFLGFTHAKTAAPNPELALNACSAPSITNPYQSDSRFPGRLVCPGIP